MLAAFPGLTKQAWESDAVGRGTGLVPKVAAIVFQRLIELLRLWHTSSLTLTVICVVYESSTLAV